MNTTKNLFKFAMIFFASLLIVTTSCKKDDDDDDDDTTKVDEYKVMTDYMKANTLDLTDMTTGPFYIAASAVNASNSDFYIIDIRSTEDYNAGHIENAVNTTFGNILTQAENAGDKPIVVCCYTGQTAAHAVVALKLSGFPDSQILLFGMSSWNASVDTWSNNTGDVADGHTNWSSTNTIEADVDYTYPTLSTGETTGAAILKKQVATMLSEGFQGVVNTTVLETPSDYFINNYWATEDIDLYGHIKTAHNIKTDLTLAAEGFKNLDKDATIVTYCWTGQTSSVITAYLNILGYDAKSLKFGANGMVHTALQAHKWSAPADFPLVQ